MADQAPTAAAGGPERPGTTRRGMLRGAAGIGLAGLAAGALAGTAAGPAAAAPAAAGNDDVKAAAHAEPLIIHVHDARTGVVDVYTGTRHVRLTDPQLAARLARAAR